MTTPDHHPKGNTMITTAELAQVFAAANGESIQANIARIRALAATTEAVDPPVVASADPSVEAWHDDDADALGIAAGF